MKKRLIISMGIILLIFIAGSLLVARNLYTILDNQRLITKQDQMIDRYNEMLFQIRSAQSELYRHQAKYTRNIDNLVMFIEGFEDNLNISLNEYSGKLNTAKCVQCHEHVENKIEGLNSILNETREILEEYKKEVSIVITTSDSEQRSMFEGKAAQKGLKLVPMITDITHIAGKMRFQIKENANALTNRAIYSIITTLFFSLILTVAAVVIIVKSVSKPVDTLVEAIRDISSGRFRKANINSNDEIGFLAKKFNTMSEKLQEMHSEKDLLLSRLRDFNRSLEDKVREATKELQIANENLLRSETLAAIGTLAAGVSHEVSTPMNTILGFTQLLISETDDTNPVKGDLKAIEQETLRAKKIIEGLLSFARTPEKEIRNVNLNSILDEIITLLFYQPSMKKTVLRKDLDTGLKKIEADPSQLKQVFLNLIINAIQAMPEGGELGIKTENQDEGTLVTVSDTGHGMSEESRIKVFQPFFTTKPEGTGLGLSICYGIIRSHGGEIIIESSEGMGSIFRIYLPVKQRQWQK